MCQLCLSRTDDGEPACPGLYPPSPNCWINTGAVVDYDCDEDREPFVDLKASFLVGFLGPRGGGGEEGSPSNINPLA